MKGWDPGDIAECISEEQKHGIWYIEFGPEVGQPTRGPATGERCQVTSIYIAPENGQGYLVLKEWPDDHEGFQASCFRKVPPDEMKEQSFSYDFNGLLKTKADETLL